MKTNMSCQWDLPVIMSRAGYRRTTDLLEPLADRGIVLSRSQVYRLTRDHEWISPQLLAALCDIFDVTLNKVILISSARIRTVRTQRVNAEQPTLLESDRPVRARILPDPDDD